MGHRELDAAKRGCQRHLHPHRPASGQSQFRCQDERATRRRVRTVAGRTLSGRDYRHASAAVMTMAPPWHWSRSEEHTSELQSLMPISYAVLRLKKNKLERNHRRHIT